MRWRPQHTRGCLTELKRNAHGRATRSAGMKALGRLPTSALLPADDAQILAVVTVRKVTRRLIPFLFVLYIAAWLDRVNVGFAALHMNSDLGFSSAAFGFGSGVFFLGYCLFEVPSNLILDRVGARLWIARIMVSWGLIASSMMFVRTPWSFYVLRFLLGVAEAGFFPGIVYYLSGWYPRAQRARAIAAFMMAIPVAGLIGGPLSGALLGLNGVYGLAGWQWLFFLEGIPSVFLGLLVLVFLTNRPEDAQWLAPAERGWLVAQLSAERQACVAAHPIGAIAALTNGTVWRLGSIFFLANVGFSAYSIWSPQIIKSFAGANDLHVGLISGAISAVTIVGMVLNSARSDRTGERPLHVAIPLLLMGAGFVATTVLGVSGLALVTLALVPIGIGAAYGPFWSMPTLFLTGEAAAGGIALVATIVNVGWFVGPTLVGILKGGTGGYSLGFVLFGGAVGAASLLTLTLRRAGTLAPLRRTPPPEGAG
jgi:MFS transporter, ACS family, tartrate transporter